METGIDCSFTFTRSFLGGRWKLKVVGHQSSISTLPIPYYISNIRIWGDLMLYLSQNSSCLFECDCMVLCLQMCVIFPACKSSVFVFLVIRVPDSGNGSALQYLVPPKPTIVPAGIQPSHSSPWSLTWCHANLFSGRSEQEVFAERFICYVDYLNRLVANLLRYSINASLTSSLHVTNSSRAVEVHSSTCDETHPRTSKSKPKWSQARPFKTAESETLDLVWSKT